MFNAIIGILHAVIYVPLYNGLVALINVMPGHDVGFAIIILTVLVRIILYPLSRRAIESQLAMKRVAPEVEAIKKKYEKPVERNEAIMKLYKERGVHPFAGVGLMLIQLLILIPLYYVFVRGGLPTIDAANLYSFVHMPQTVNMLFLGFVDMAAKHNLMFAILVALSQLISTRLSMGKTQQDSAIEESLSSDMAKSFDFQARYVMPLIMGVIAYLLPTAAPLYLLTTNVFMIGQEYWSGRRL